MSFLSTSSRRTRRSQITCARCGDRITLSDRIHKDGDGFIHERCPTPAAATIPEQRS